MKFTQRTVALAAACALLVGPVAAAAQAPAPAQPAAPKKLISPVRGEANVEITKPNTNKKGTEVTTVIMVKNVSTAPIAGFKIEENWYDKGGVPVGGDIYRHPKPFMPGEIITVTLKTPWKASMQSNQYQFTHANGAVKPKTVPKITPNPTD
jgi:flagellar basal body L-ring protein FlgH